MDRNQTRWVRFIVASVFALIVAHLVDYWAYHNAAISGFETGYLGQMFRAVGYGPTWLLIVFGLLLYDRSNPGLQAPRPYTRAGLVFSSVAVGGMTAEVLKIVFRRMRPDAGNGTYVFRPWSEMPFYSGGLGLPSSHALVAFSGAAIMTKLLPGTGPAWYLAAAGCAFTRVVDQDHFVSDVVLSLILSWVVVELFWRRFGGGIQTRPATGPTAVPDTPFDSSDSSDANAA